MRSRGLFRGPGPVRAGARGLRGKGRLLGDPRGQSGWFDVYSDDSLKAYRPVHK